MDRLGRSTEQFLGRLFFNVIGAETLALFSIFLWASQRVRRVHLSADEKNTISQATVHNWVHKADLQPASGHSPDHVAVDETVIRLNDQQYWLYAAVDPETNELLHTELDPTTNSVLAQQFLAQLREKHDVEDAVFLIDGSLTERRVLSRRVRSPRPMIRRSQ